MIARFFILFSILLFSCENENRQGSIDSEQLLSEKQMIDILTDVHIVEGAKIGRKIMGDTLMMDAYYRKIFSKHKIDKKQLDENYRYYSSDPEKMDGIYEKVLDNLNKLQVEVPKWNAIDSIKNPGFKSKKDSLKTKALVDSLMQDTSFIDRRSLKNLRPSKLKP